MNQKKNHQKIIKEVQNEISAFNENASKIIHLETSMRELTRKLDESKGIVNTIEKTISEKNEWIGLANHQIGELSEKISSFSAIAENDFNSKISFLENEKSKEESALNSYNRIIERVCNLGKKYFLTRNLEKKVNKIINKKFAFEKILLNIENENRKLREKYLMLMKKVDEVKLNSDCEVVGEMRNLELELNESDEKKNIIEKKISKFLSLFT